MTNPRDDETGDEPALDVEAEFARIVEAYGDQLPEDGPPAPVVPPTPEALTERFRSRGWSDPLNTEATWEDEGHFVPPEPPPLSVPEPRRLVAWLAVLGAPLVMMGMVLLNVTPEAWLSFLLVVAFIGGFVALVATMRRDDDHRPGDDGAVL